MAMDLLQRSAYYLVYHQSTGCLISQHKEAIQAEIDHQHQLSLRMEDLLEEDRYYLSLVT